MASSSSQWKHDVLGDAPDIDSVTLDVADYDGRLLNVGDQNYANSEFRSLWKQPTPDDNNNIDAHFVVVRIKGP